DAKPFLSIGQVINQGDVICIIEAMKVMNEIKATVSGVVTKILVDDGMMVEFDQVLIEME
ncbi:MAG: acetyl-CoA carboxylase biotin carboxyl carrier protein, partial [Bacilli bacterium]